MSLDERPLASADRQAGNGPPRFPFRAERPGEAAPEFARLREECPVSRVTLPTGDQAWLVTLYGDNRTLLTDTRFSRAATAVAGAPRLQPIPPDPTSMLQMDPPEHSRLRSLVARGFTARRTETLRPAIRAQVELLLDDMAATGPPYDLVLGFARVLPLTVVSELLGLPVRDRTRIGSWVDILLSLTTFAPHEVGRARKEFKDYLAGQVAEKRARPADDLLSRLVAIRDEGDSLSEEELVMLGATIITGGFLTTAAQIALSCLCLLRHPDQLALLRGRPELLPSAVDELLRYNSLTTGGGLLRIATEDIEVGGVTIHAGEAVLPALSSANRDASVFADPETFDITRRPNPHIAFGLGAHFCLGAQLAKIELEEALDGLFGRFPTLRLEARDQDLRVNHGHLVRGLPELPVAW
ncbi:cytochrome P450 [Streptosporangium soli]|nr:cytochrome P450 [Streptosporangium sp. KLBMP 9127]